MVAVSNSSGDDNCTSNVTHHDTHSAHTSHGTVLFLFAAFAVGALVRHALKRTPIPYTVLLMVVGLIFGAFSGIEAMSFLHDYTSLASIDPHLMLFIFLPTLIFESAFVMDVHTFRKTIGQAVVLAGPGLLLCSFLTSLIARFIFPYHWTWVASLMFGTILSATDPVAVVALLKDLGASKQLGTIIEGESLLNDGAAIVLFNVFLVEIQPGQSQTVLEIFLYFVKVAFGGPLFGYIMAKITIFWLSHVFNDALVEITITLASTYITFYIGEGLLEVSGVLAVVTLGIELNSRRTSISPEVEAFLHRFWSMLGYLANTLIFVLVGVVIAQKAFSDVEGTDWIFMIVLYFGIVVIRLLVIGGLMPVLTNIGYTVDWKQVTVITWGGLRGAVGLALALVVAQTPGIHHSIGSKVLFHSAGIVMLTLVVNATTTKYLLAALGMSDISHATRVTMAQAVRRVREARQRAVSVLKSDHFLADANWEMVENTTQIENPYRHLAESVRMAKDGVLVATVKDTQECPNCETQVPRMPHPKELAELAEEVRQRMIKAERTSYWRQFEEGMLGRDAVLVLIHLADSVLDTPERLITLKDLRPYWQIPFILTKIRQWLLRVRDENSTSESFPAPTHRFCSIPYFIVNHSLFEWTLFAIIAINGACTIAEFLTTSSTARMALEYINFVFVAIYIFEAILKLIGLRQYYFLSKWNIFDMLILIVSLIDVIIELSVPESNSKKFSPAVFRLIRIFRILRVSRVLRLLKVLVPLFIAGVDNVIHRRLRFGYDIGKGFVMGEDEMLQQFDRFGGLVHKKIALELRLRAESTRLDVIKSLGQMRKHYPGVALSVKTHQATRSVLNHCRDTIKSLLGSGLLDENEAEKLFMAIEKKMKHLERTPGSLRPPDPATILQNLPWLSGLSPEVVFSLLPHAQLLQLEQGDCLQGAGAEATGITVIVSGLVKVTMSVDPPGGAPAEDVGLLEKSLSIKEKEEEVEGEEKDKEEEEKEGEEKVEGEEEEGEEEKEKSGKTVEEFYGAGAVLGEMGVLENNNHVVSIECETPVRAFFVERDSMQSIMQEYPVVEERLWRVSGIHAALQLLPQLPEYQDWPMTKLMMMCDGAYIATPPNEPAPTFEITSTMKEVLVVSGEVLCMDSREKLMAPCVIPHNVRYLMMSVGSPKLLVISVTGNKGTGGEGEGDEEEEELQFKPPHVTIPLRERLKTLFFSCFYSCLACIQHLTLLLERVRTWRMRRHVNDDDDVAIDEEGRGLHDDSLDHTHMRPEPEITSSVLQMEMEAATPLPGESVTTPPAGSTHSLLPGERVTTPPVGSAHSKMTTHPVGSTHSKMATPPVGSTHSKLATPPVGSTHSKMATPPVGSTHSIMKVDKEETDGQSIRLTDCPSVCLSETEETRPISLQELNSNLNSEPTVTTTD